MVTATEKQLQLKLDVAQTTSILRTVPVSFFFLYGNTFLNVFRFLWFFEFNT